MPQSLNAAWTRTKSLNSTNMSDKETKVVDEVEESEEVTTDETTEEVVEDVDYKAELNRITSERDRYKSEASQKGRDLRELRKEKRETQPESVEETTGLEIESIVKKQLNAIDRRNVQDTIEDSLEDMISNPDERDLVRSIYENDLNPSGHTKRAIKEDIRKARLLANRSKYEADVEKQIRKSVAETEAIKNSSTSVRSKVKDEKSSTEPRLTKEEKEFQRKWRAGSGLK